MDAAGHTVVDRALLAPQAELPLQVILECAKLADLSRTVGVKAIQARPHYDASLDTLEK